MGNFYSFSEPNPPDDDDDSMIFIEVKNDIMPVEEAIMPVEEAIMPVEEAIMPVEEAIMPVEEAIMPVKNDIVPVKKDIAPVKNDINYIYNDILYIYSFPKTWSQNHILNTGPEYCTQCVSFGTVNGIFIGYCSDCARMYDNYERGLGFINNRGDEATVDVDYLLNSAFFTYLKDVSPSDLNII
jgi:hypothetical protein